MIPNTGRKSAMDVVVIDDSEIIRTRLTELLSSLEDVQVIGEAENALDGTRIVREMAPEVVILDIKMPLGSGLDVLRNISKSNPETKVIVLTNYPYEQYRTKCRELGARYFFDKSTEFDKLPGVLDQLRIEGNEEQDQE